MLDALATEAAKHGLKAVTDWLAMDRLSNALSRHDVEEALTTHLRFAKNWCQEFLLDDMAHSRTLNEIFVEPTLVPGKSPLSNPAQARQPYRSLLMPGRNRVVFGFPGAGKTTLVMRLCYHLLFDPGEASSCYDFPIVVRFRELYATPSLVDHLLNVLQIYVNEEFKIRTNSKRPDQPKEQRLGDVPEKLASIKEQMVIRFFNARRALLLLDGFDELPPTIRESHRRELERLSHHIETSDFLMTSRSAITVGELKRVDQFFVSPFTDEDIKAFVSNWFGEESRSQNFLKELSVTTYAGTAVRPLTLATLCALFDRYNEIPSPPREIYRRIVTLYLEKWDDHRDVSRVSEYGRFGSDRKREFLASVAYELSKRSNSIQFSHGQLKVVYTAVHEQFRLPLDQATKVLEEIESHNGLVVRAGFESFEFYHKSIFEYLCGDILSRLPAVPKNAAHLISMPDACAVATSLSADPNSFVALLALRLFERSEMHHPGSEKVAVSLEAFWTPYLSRCRIEDVVFEPDEILGITFLTLCSLAWQFDRNAKALFVRRSDHKAYHETLIEFANLPQVRSAVAMLRDDFEMIKSTSSWFRLRKRGRKSIEFFGPVPSDFILDHRFREYWAAGLPAHR